jgi:hypothetical protein
MSDKEKKAENLKIASIVVGVLGVVCLIFSMKVADYLSFVLGKGDSAELAVFGAGFVLVLVYFYLKTKAKKAADALVAKESPNDTE